MHSADHLAAMGGTQKADPAALGPATAWENRGLAASRKTTPAGRAVPRPPLLRRGAAGEADHHPTTTSVPKEPSTHTPKPTVTPTADTSVSPIYEGEDANSPQTSPQTAPKAKGDSRPPALASFSGTIELGIHHRADPPVPPAGRGSTQDPSAAAGLALENLTAPSVEGTGQAGRSPSVLGATGLPGPPHSTRVASSRTQSSTATATTTWLGTTATGKGFYRFIGSE